MCSFSKEKLQNISGHVLGRTYWAAFGRLSGPLFWGDFAGHFLGGPSAAIATQIGFWSVLPTFAWCRFCSVLSCLFLLETCLQASIIYVIFRSKHNDIVGVLIIVNIVLVWFVEFTSETRKQLRQDREHFWQLIGTCYFEVVYIINNESRLEMVWSHVNLQHRGECDTFRLRSAGVGSFGVRICAQNRSLLVQKKSDLREDPERKL